MGESESSIECYSNIYRRSEGSLYGEGDVGGIGKGRDRFDK